MLCARFQWTPGRRGVDIAFDCACKENTIGQTIHVVRNAGRVVITGIPSEINTPVDMHELRRKEAVLYNVRRSNHETGRRRAHAARTAETIRSDDYPYLADRERPDGLSRCSSKSRTARPKSCSILKFSVCYLHRMTSRCAVCGSENNVLPEPRAESLEPPDFDTRPGAPLRSTISTWVQCCDRCGYCAADISVADSKAHEVVGSDGYVATLSNTGCAGKGSPFPLLRVPARQDARNTRMPAGVLCTAPGFAMMRTIFTQPRFAASRRSSTGSEASTPDRHSAMISPPSMLWFPISTGAWVNLSWPWSLARRR